MDKTTLVRSDFQIGGRVIDALSRAKIPVTLCDWNFVPELDEWQLVIATPWNDTKGPREAYTRVIKALQNAGIYQDVPIRRVFVRSPSDSLVKALEREMREHREGEIHIVRYSGARKRNQYSVVFFPYAGPGGSVPARRFSDVSELREFLEEDLQIRASSIEEALTELDRSGSASISRVQLTARELKKLGLG